MLEPVSVANGRQEELSLESTPTLKQILSTEQALEIADDGPAIDDDGGSGPYNSG